MENLKEHKSIFEIKEINRLKLINNLKNATNKQLEIFIRQRLGQEDAVFCTSEQEHLRFSFHSETSEDIINNAVIIQVFDDIWNSGDHDHTPIVLGYKGSIRINSTNFNIEDAMDNHSYCGDTTTEILIDLIKNWVNGNITCVNGDYERIRNR